MRIINSGSMSDRGMNRHHNEDFFHLDTGRGICIVADGMGGHLGGEVASREAVETFLGLIKPRIDEGAVFDAQLLKDAVEKTNRHVFRKSLEDEELKGMGTTFVAGILHRNGMFLVNVGDSRAYRIRDDTIEQLTRDHSLVQEMLEEGKLTSELANTYQFRHVITRVIGSEKEVEPDIETLPVEDGDMLLFCSDGLTEMLEDSEILDLCRQGKSVQAMARDLVLEANKRGGKDNITVIIAEIGMEREDSLSE